jgi:hypothetical protein
MGPVMPGLWCCCISCAEGSWGGGEGEAGEGVAEEVHQQAQAAVQQAEAEVEAEMEAEVEAGAAATGEEGEELDATGVEEFEAYKVLRHHVKHGAKPGSPHNVHVLVWWEGCNKPSLGGAMEPMEHLVGTGALTKYLKTVGGKKIVKYMPA